MASGPAKRDSNALRTSLGWTILLVPLVSKTGAARWCGMRHPLIAMTYDHSQRAVIRRIVPLGKNHPVSRRSLFLRSEEEERCPIVCDKQQRLHFHHGRRFVFLRHDHGLEHEWRVAHFIVICRRSLGMFNRASSQTTTLALASSALCGLRLLRIPIGVLHGTSDGRFRGSRTTLPALVHVLRRCFPDRHKCCAVLVALSGLRSYSDRYWLDCGSCLGIRVAAEKPPLPDNRFHRHRCRWRGDIPLGIALGQARPSTRHDPVGCRILAAPIGCLHDREPHISRAQ